MAKKKLSPKRAYHKRWHEQQKILREEAKERRAIKKEQHELRMKLQAEGNHEAIKELFPPKERKQPKSKVVDVEICLARDGISEFMSWTAQYRWEKHRNHCYLEFNNSMRGSAAKTRSFTNWRQALKRLTRNSTYEGLQINSIRYRGKLLWQAFRLAEQ